MRKLTNNDIINVITVETCEGPITKVFVGENKVYQCNDFFLDSDGFKLIIELKNDYRIVLINGELFLNE